MLYFFYGSDKDAAREKARALIDELRKGEPDAEVFRLTAEGWGDPLNPLRGTARLEELIGGQGLFNNCYIVEIVQLFESPEAKEGFLKKLPDIAASPNIFVSREGAADKETLLLVNKHAEKVQICNQKEGKKKPEFNIFSLTDAFGRRDKKQLWVLLQKAVASGAVPEEIHGILFWQLKSIVLALQCKTAEEAGVEPFVWSKARTFAKNWSEDELKSLSSKMVSLYHDAHRGIHEFEIALERFVLTL
jgi:hypothetical protein